MTTIPTEYAQYQRLNIMQDLAKAAHGKYFLGQTSSATYPEIASRISSMHLSPKDRILDAGCGNGAFALKLAKESPYFIEGVDLSDDLIAAAKDGAEKAGLLEKCHFSTQDFSDLSGYTDALFRCIICIGSLYWGQPLIQTFNTWHRITSPGAELLLFLNMHYDQFSFEEQSAIGNTQFIPESLIREELIKQGWVITEWFDGTPLYIQWLKRWCSAMNKAGQDLIMDMGREHASQLSNRFNTYLKLAERKAVRRIIVKAQHV